MSRAVEITLRGRRLYSIDVQDRARELHAAHWSIREIATLLAREYHLDKPPRWNTINEWVNPKLAQQRRRDDRVRHRDHRTADYSYPGRRSVEWKLGRMRALRKDGLSPAAISKVMARDFPADEPLSEHEVRQVIAGRTPMKLRDRGGLEEAA